MPSTKKYSSRMSRLDFRTVRIVFVGCFVGCWGWTQRLGRHVWLIVTEVIGQPLTWDLPSKTPSPCHAEISWWEMRGSCLSFYAHRKSMLNIFLTSLKAVVFQDLCSSFPSQPTICISSSSLFTAFSYFLWGGTLATACMWRSKDNLWGLVLLSYHVDL